MFDEDVMLIVFETSPFGLSSVFELPTGFVGSFLSPLMLLLSSDSCCFDLAPFRENQEGGFMMTIQEWGKIGRLIVRRFVGSCN